MPLTLLHLSDAHIGRPRDNFKSNEVLNPLLDDLRLGATEHGIPDVVIFSGDLAYGPQPGSALADQYKKAREWIDKWYQALGTNLKKTPLFLVPGNHDINRAKILDETTLYLTNADRSKEIEKAMEERSYQLRSWLARQSDWQEFAKQICDECGVTLDTDLNLTFLERNVDSKKIGIVGLNTSWTSHKNNEKGCLWLGEHQIRKAIDLVTGCDLRIAVTHHPFSWLNQWDSRLQKRVAQEFQIHFHGHEHDSWFDLGLSHLRVEGGACYADSPDEKGYGWLQLDLREKTGKLWLRELTRKGKFEWKPAHYPGRTDSAGYADVSAFLAEPQTTPKLSSRTPGVESEAANGFSSLTGPGDLATILQSEYGFVWESEDYKSLSPQKTVVYWPVRLREPTAIHAVQAFAASGLMQKGATVILCIDDLGTKFPIELLEKALKKYVSKVGGDWRSVDVQSFSSLITDSSFSEASRLMRQWLADLDYNLPEVFEIAKMLDRQTSQVDNAKKPRRLFTPPLVWFCFIQMIEKFGANVTMGGYDERPLWEAWRRVTRGQHLAGHLYIPELRVSEGIAHMSDTKLRLRWDGLQDIELALRQATQDTEPFATGRLLPWSFLGCFQLPCYISNQNPILSIAGKNVRSVSELTQLDPNELIKPLAARFERWMI